MRILCVQGKLMTSWAVVCDVYFLEPQKKAGDESAQQFAERVQRLIAERAKLQIAPWDGYLKYYTLGIKVPGPSRTLACFLALRDCSAVTTDLEVVWWSSACHMQRRTREHARCLC